MSHAERALVAALRSEIAAVDPARPCDRRAELAGLGPAAPRDPVVARLALRLGRRAAAIDGPATDPAFDFVTAPDHCRAAYLRGRFLAAGSLSLANGRTHLEFVVPAAEGPVLAAWLALAGLPAAWRLRRGRGVVTWKSGETVGLFLRRIGAAAALLELEARQVARAMRGEMNRVLNAESANLGRAVAAAGRQLAAIELLEREGRLAEQPYVVRVVADGRRETPEATFSELAGRLGLHRSAVQRALDRLERLALHEAGSPLA
jgi:DNA-binding protein WhiA